MCAKCDTLETDLTVEVLLAQAERQLILAQNDSGESVPQAVRPLSAAEKRAKMRFGEIHDLEENAAEKAAKLLASNAQVYIMAVISAIFGEDQTVEAGAVIAAFERLAYGKIPAAATEAADKLALSIGEILAGVYAGASVIALGEAARQGMKDLPDPLTAKLGRFDDLARAVALHPWTRLTSKLQAEMLTPKALLTPPDRDAVTATLRAIPLDGAEDLARQTIHTAHGAGRNDTATSLEPESVHASELLDGQTCFPCSQVDGKNYDTLEEALTEYETGGFGSCKGGNRCRGTLVYHYGG